MNQINIKNQLFTKNIQSKSCRATEKIWRFSIERKIGRGSVTGGCCVAGHVLVFEKPHVHLS